MRIKGESRKVLTRLDSVVTMLSQAKGGCCARELARALECCEKSVYRSVDCLRDLGHPIDYDPADRRFRYRVLAPERSSTSRLAPGCLYPLLWGDKWLVKFRGPLSVPTWVAEMSTCPEARDAARLFAAAPDQRAALAMCLAVLESQRVGDSIPLDSLAAIYEARRALGLEASHGEGSESALPSHD